MGAERFKPQSPLIAERLAGLFPHKKEFAGFQEWNDKIRPKLYAYLDWLNDEFFAKDSPDRYTPEDGIRVLDLMGRNHLMAHVLTTPEYEEIIGYEKILRGDENVTIGVARCIDGRLPNQENRLVKIHESKAGLLETTMIMGKEGRKKKVLTSGRMIEAVKGEADKGPLLQVLLAHTDEVEMPCDCGAMLAVKNAYAPGTDLVLENLNLHKNAAEAIDTLYNEEVAYNVRKKRRNQIPQQRTAITAVYETSTQGVVLGYGEGELFSTTAIARELAPQMNEGYSGVLIGKTLDITEVVNNEKMIYEVTQSLLDPTNTFFKQTTEYIQRNTTLSELNTAQQYALLFYLGRTTAIQLLTKSYDASVENPFRKHEEEFLSLSQDDAMVGQILPGQVFCASPHPNQVIDHVTAQVTLMNHYAPKRKTPDILFISDAQMHETTGKNDASKGLTLEMLRKIFTDPQLEELIRTHKLLPIPVIINSKTRDITYMFDPVGIR